MRVASVQTDVVFGYPAANLAVLRTHCHELAQKQVELVVFPEAFLTGYCARSIEEAEAIALEFKLDGDVLVQGDANLEELGQLAVLTGVHIVVGFVGCSGGKLYNVAALADPKGQIRCYVKTHLPLMGFDNYATPGERLPVFETEIGKIGLLICFDVRFPEAARTLALQGADVIVMPTNWPQGVVTPPQLLVPTRAVENKVFFVTCNRIGTENGTKFCGLSAIHGVHGEVQGSLHDQEGVIVADLNLELARDKRNSNGACMTDLFATRNAAAYQFPSFGGVAGKA